MESLYCNIAFDLIKYNYASGWSYFVIPFSFYYPPPHLFHIEFSVIVLIFPMINCYLKLFMSFFAYVLINLPSTYISPLKPLICLSLLFAFHHMELKYIIPNHDLSSPWVSTAYEALLSGNFSFLIFAILKL